MANPALLATKLTREHAAEMLVMEGEELAKLGKIYGEALDILRGKLASVGADTFTAQQTRVVLAQVTAALRAMNKKLGESWDKTLDQRMQRAVTQTLKEIAHFEPKFKQAQGAIQTQVVRKLAGPHGLLLNQFETSIATYGTGLIRKVGDRLALHAVTKSSWSAMARDVSKTASIDVWRAERIVRTELINALDAAQQVSFDEFRELLPDLKSQWDATNDARVCPICRHLNGLVAGPKQLFSGRWNGPPAHPNCRCRRIPFRSTWAKDIAADEAAEEARAAAALEAEREAQRKADAAARARQLELAAQNTAAAKRKFIDATAEGAPTEGLLTALQEAVEAEQTLLGLTDKALDAKLGAAIADAVKEARAAFKAVLDDIEDGIKVARQGFIENATTAGLLDATDAKLSKIVLESHVRKRTKLLGTQAGKDVTETLGQADELAKAEIAKRRAFLAEGAGKAQDQLIEELAEANETLTLEHAKGAAAFPSLELRSTRFLQYGNPKITAKSIAQIIESDLHDTIVIAKGKQAARLTGALNKARAGLTSASAETALDAKAALEYAATVHGSVVGGLGGDALEQFVQSLVKSEIAKATEAIQKLFAPPPDLAAMPFPKTQSAAPDAITLPGSGAAKKIQNSTGSNPGGFYKAGDGSTWFVKFPKSVAQVGAEDTAAALARRMGLTTKDYTVAPVGTDSVTHVGIASPKVAFTELGQSALKTWVTQDELADHFVHAAWTRNWDVVGLGYDNLVAMNGKLVVVDYGGSFLWRAQGALKPGGLPDAVEELTSLRSAAKNTQTASVFGGLTDEKIAQRIRATLSKITDEDLHDILSKGHFEKTDFDAVYDGLRKRRDSLLTWANDKLPKVSVADAEKSLLGDLTPDVRKHLSLTAQADANKLTGWWTQALEGNGARQAQWGRRLWTGSPDVVANKDLSLRFLQNAWNVDAATTAVELQKWDTMTDVLEALKSGVSKGQGTIDALRDRIAQIESARVAAAANAATEAARAAEQAAAAAAARKAAHKVALEEYEKKLAALNLPVAETKTGALTAAYKKKLLSWASQLAETPFGEAARRAREAFMAGTGKGAERAFRAEVERLAKEAGVLPKPPRGLDGLETPKRLYQSQPDSFELQKQIRELSNQEGVGGLHDLHAFTGSKYRHMRAAMRGRREVPIGNGRTSTMNQADFEMHQRAALRLNNLIKQMPGYEVAPGKFITRKESWFQAGDRDAFEQILKSQTHMTWPSLSSASSNPNVWSGDLVYRIRGRTSGTPIANVSSVGASEQEVLFPGGVHFRITSWQKTAKGFIVDLEEEFVDGP